MYLMELSHSVIAGSWAQAKHKLFISHLPWTSAHTECKPAIPKDWEHTLCGKWFVSTDPFIGYQNLFHPIWPLNTAVIESVKSAALCVCIMWLHPKKLKLLRLKHICLNPVGLNVIFLSNSPIFTLTVYSSLELRVLRAYHGAIGREAGSHPGPGSSPLYF